MLTQGDTHSTEHAGRAVVGRDGIQRLLAFNQVFDKRLKRLKCIGALLKIQRQHAAQAVGAGKVQGRGKVQAV